MKTRLKIAGRMREKHADRPADSVSGCCDGRANGFRKSNVVKCRRPFGKLKAGRLGAGRSQTKPTVGGAKWQAEGVRIPTYSRVFPDWPKEFSTTDGHR